MEARNIFHGLVDWEYLKEYLQDQVQKDAIIPDILVHNYPGDNNAHGNAVVPAMFDIKTVRIDKRGAIYKVGVRGRRGGIDRAVKKKTKACQSNYLSRAKKLDEKFANGDASKPFQRAIQQTFTSGNAIPLVFGAVGEFCVEGHRLVELLARYAAAKAENLDITPDKVNSAKRSPYNTYLSQFRRAIGCMAIRTAVEENLRRVTSFASVKLRQIWRLRVAWEITDSAKIAKHQLGFITFVTKTSSMLSTDTELTMITFHQSMDSLRNFEFGYMTTVQTVSQML